MVFFQSKKTYLVLLFSLLAAACSKIDSASKKSVEFSDQTLAGSSSTAPSTTSTSTNSNSSPTAPSLVAVTTISSSQINVTWNDLSLNESSFEIQYSIDSNFNTFTSLSAQLNTTTSAITNLSEAATYYVRIRALNGSSFSNYSSSLSATTFLNSPNNLQASTASTSQINLTWTDNSSVESGYTIQYSTDSSLLTNSQTKTVATNATSASITGLSANTTYYFKVQATHSTLAASAFSNIANAKTNTNPTAPNAPSNLTALATSSSTINLSWTDNATDETGFTLEQATTSTFAAPVTTTTYAANITTATISGLTASTPYYYRVKATNAVGSSSVSNTATATTQAPAAVNPPTIITLTNPTTNPGVLTTPTFSISGNVAAGNTVKLYQKSGTTNCGTLVGTATASTTSVSIASTVALSASGTYQFYSTVQNTNGTSACSTVFGSYTLDITPPNAPTSLVLNTPISSPTNLTTPIIQVGGVVAGDTVQIFANSSTCASTALKGNATVAASATTVNITSSVLAQGSYLFYAKSIDSLGNTSACSTASSPNLLIDTTAPSVSISAPTSDAVISGTAATVSASSSDTGGAGIQKVEFYLGTTFIGTDTTAPFSIFLNTTSYSDGIVSISAKATDLAGNVTTSTTVSVIIQNATTPIAPTNLAGSATGTTTAMLTWSDNSNNESSFTIERAPTNAFASITPTTANANTTGIDLSGLSAATTYYFRIKAVNSAGSSGYSNTVTITTQSSSGGGATFNPTSYWKVDGTLTDEKGSYPLTPYGTSNHEFTTEAVNGQSIRWPDRTKTSYIQVGNMPRGSSAVTKMVFEFELKPAQEFLAYQDTRILSSKAMSIAMSYDSIVFNTTSDAGADNFSVTLNGINRKSIAYHVDGNWHHYVFIYDAAAKTKMICIDGICPTEFAKTLTTGTNIPVSASGIGSLMGVISWGVDYVALIGSLDNIAYYENTIPNSNLIYQHYQQMIAGQPYNFTDNGTAAPAQPLMTAGLNPQEFAPGMVLPTTGDRSTGVTTHINTQMQTFKIPAYRKFSSSQNTMMRNFNWMDLDYLGGRQLQPSVTSTQVTTDSATMNRELARNWNYGIYVGKTAWNTDANSSEFQSVPAHTVILWAQLKYPDNSSSNIVSNNLSTNHYLTNSSGQFLDTGGNVTTNKLISPDAPLSTFYTDGDLAKTKLQSLRSALTRPLNMVNENGEVIPLFGSTALSQDSTVVADAKAYLGITTTPTDLQFQQYQGEAFRKLTRAYADQFMGGTYSQSGGLSQLISDGTKFTHYAVDGQNDYRHYYERARLVQSPLRTLNGNPIYYSTGDFYPRWADNWRFWSASWHGFQWFLQARDEEIARGDVLFSPYMSRGWNAIDDNNITPDQWLGQHKLMANMGAEFFYESHFSLDVANMPDPNNWGWTATTATYAQSVFSYGFEEFFLNGDLLKGDGPLKITNTSTKGYWFLSGRPDVPIIVRKSKTSNRFLIAAALQAYSNMNGAAPDSVNVTLKLPVNSVTQTLKFKARQQGSVYLYDATDAANPVFYQLDGYQENTHPWYWSKDEYIQAELLVNDQSQNSKFTIRTEYDSAPTSLDFTNTANYRTYAALSSSAPANTCMEYRFQPRTTGTKYLWVRAKNTSTSTALTVSLNGGTSQTISITGNTWQWYKVNSTGANISLSPNTTSMNELKLCPSATGIMLDQLTITTNAPGTATAPGIPGSVSN